MKAGQRRRMQTSGRVFVCASFKLSLCHCQDEACVRVCGCIASPPGFVCTRHVSRVSGHQSQSQTFRGFHILTFKQIFGGDQEKRKRESPGEKKKERKSKRGTEKALNLELCCCCWHLLKGFSVRQGARLTVSL